jgi:hypothetical protein
MSFKKDKQFKIKIANNKEIIIKKAYIENEIENIKEFTDYDIKYLLHLMEHLINSNTLKNKNIIVDLITQYSLNAYKYKTNIDVKNFLIRYFNENNFNGIEYMDPSEFLISYLLSKNDLDISNLILYIMNSTCFLMNYHDLFIKCFSLYKAKITKLHKSNIENKLLNCFDGIKNEIDNRYSFDPMCLFEKNYESLIISTLNKMINCLKDNNIISLILYNRWKVILYDLEKILTEVTYIHTPIESYLEAHMNYKNNLCFLPFKNNIRI